MNLSEQACLVTDSSRGIERGITEQLGDHGAAVIVNHCTSEGDAVAVINTIEDADMNGAVDL
jgi:3-oxoacyl-[acyl-carrier protein] reductase